MKMRWQVNLQIKGITLVGLLLVVFLLAILAMIGIHVLHNLADRTIFFKEQQKLQHFLRAMQNKIAHSNSIWYLVINRNILSNQWCMAIQISANTICDCFHPKTCPSSARAEFYHPYFMNKTTLIAKQYYPKPITRFGSVRNTALASCFALQSGQHKVLFVFFNVGSLKIKNNHTLSACKNDQIL